MKMNLILCLALLSLVGAANETPAPSVRCERICRTPRETPGLTNLSPIQEIDDAEWIWIDVPEAESVPLIVRFRLPFQSDGTAFDLDVSADERFVLTIDGLLVSRGPHRGLVDHWNYQSYRIRASKGPHVIEATVSRLGSFRPSAQVSWRGGFILKASGRYDALLTTGKANWKASVIRGTKCVRSDESRTGGLVGWPFEVVGASWIHEIPDTAAFRPVKTVRGRVVTQIYGDGRPGWMLYPTTLPDQLEKIVSPGELKAGPKELCDRLNALLAGGAPVVLPPGTDETVLWDLGDYFCAYPELAVSGGQGSVIDWHWAESLYDGKGRKNRRDMCEGLRFQGGMGDRFRADGRANAVFTVPWWRCGRWCRLRFKVGDKPLTLTKLAFAETRYPLGEGAHFACSDETLGPIWRICRRALENCTHETLMDCPFYEQAMYPGDGRVELQMLATLSADRRVAQTAMSIFDWSRRNDGFVPMVAPLNGVKDSATYTLCWIMMFGDYAKNGTDAAWLKAHLPGMRAALEGFVPYEDARGLVSGLPGWCYVDALGWKNGIPPGGRPGERPGCVINLQYLQALQAAVTAERAVGETAFAALHEERATRLRQAIRAAFLDAGRGLLAETEAHTNFTAHAQCLGILTGTLPTAFHAKAVEALSDFKRAGFPAMGAYFRSYLFETFFACGRADLFLQSLGDWRAMVAAGLSTTTESGRLSGRSDCHAWSASPLYFMQTGLAGVQPSSPLYGAVRIAPQPGSLSWIEAVTPTPKGDVAVRLRFSDGKASGTVTLPFGLPGEFVWRGKSVPLQAGLNRIGE